jgi:hypothetical protein
MACSCNSCNSCECSNEYRVSTGAVGPTGSTGATGPAGPAGNREFLYATGSTTGVATTGTGSYETLGTYTLPAGELSANFDSLRINAKFWIASNTRDKYIRLAFGASTTTPYLINVPISSFWTIGPAELTFEVMRITSTTQTLAQTFLRGDSSQIISFYFTGAENLANTVTITAQAQTQAAGVGINDVKLINFTVEKITAP